MKCRRISQTKKNLGVLHDTAMSTIDSNISSNEDTEMKSPPMHESSNTEPDVGETSNIGTKSSTSKTKKVIQDDAIIKPSGLHNVAMSTVDSNTSLNRQTEMETSPTKESLTRESDVDESLKNDTKSPTLETKNVIQNVAAIPPTDS